MEAARRRRLTEDLGAGVGALLPPTAGPASTDGEKERQAGARSPGRKKAKRAKQKKDPAKKAKLVSKEEEGEPAREPPRARVEVAPQTRARHPGSQRGTQREEPERSQRGPQRARAGERHPGSQRGTHGPREARNRHTKGAAETVTDQTHY